MIKRFGCGVGVLLALVSGCSGLAPEDAAEGAGEEWGAGEVAEAEVGAGASNEEAPAEVIAEVSHEGVEYTFVDDDGAVAIEVSGKLGAPQPALFRLTEEYGQLTALEIFGALAGDEAVADERLVAAHVAEAQALGREDGAVLDLELSPAGAVEKGSLADCKTLASNAAKSVGNPAPIVNGVTRSVGVSMATGLTNKGMAGGLCNDDVAYGGSMKADFRRKRETDATWVYITSATVPLGTYWFLTGIPTPFQRQMLVTATFLGAAHPYHIAVGY
jgi:hypothetical protein